jgi:catechol 2,3-dioxygenase-like lactoylglutathione lyase family enzyme
MTIAALDHWVLTAADVGATAAFYERVLGMKVVTFGAGRTALEFGRQKINLHQAGREFPPHAKTPQPGALDFCLLTEEPITKVIAHLQSCGVPVEEGPVQRTGATGPILSVYFRDPDGNLVEVAKQLANTTLQAS